MTEILKEFEEIINKSSEKIEINKSQITFNGVNLTELGNLELLLGICKENNIKSLIFKNCVVGQDLFNIMDDKTVKIEGIQCEFCKPILKNVDLSKYKSLKSLKEIDVFDEVNPSNIFENALNLEVIIEVLEYIKKCNYFDEDRKPVKNPTRMDLSKINIEGLMALYSGQSKINSYNNKITKNRFKPVPLNILLVKEEFNNVKLSKEHVLYILELDRSEKFIEREKGNLMGFDLNNLNLAGVLSQRRKSSYISLEDTKFDNAHLENSNLTDVYAKRASFVKTVLTKAILNGANFEKANFNEAKLCEAKLKKANMYEAKLENTDLSKADLTNAKLIGAKLNGANLNYAILENANLENADLTNANLENANLKGTILKNANLSSVKINDKTEFDNNTNINGARISREQVEKILNLGENETFFGRKRGELYNLNLENLDLSNLEFSGVNLARSSLKNANLTNSNLECADLSNSVLECANLSSSNLKNANLKNSNLKRIKLENNSTGTNSKGTTSANDTNFKEAESDNGAENSEKLSGVKIDIEQVKGILDGNSPLIKCIGIKSGNLSRLDLSYLTFEKEMGSKFDKADIRGTNFDNCCIKCKLITQNTKFDEHTSFKNIKVSEDFVESLLSKKEIIEKMKNILKGADLSLIENKKSRKILRRHYVENYINKELYKLNLEGCIVNFKTVKYLLDKKIAIIKDGKGINKSKFKKLYHKNEECEFILKAIEGIEGYCLEQKEQEEQKQYNYLNNFAI